MTKRKTADELTAKIYMASLLSAPLSVHSAARIELETPILKYLYDFLDNIPIGGLPEGYKAWGPGEYRQELARRAASSNRSAPRSA